MTESIAVQKVIADLEIQAREAVDEEVVVSYSLAYQRGESMPPIIVFVDPQNRVWLADGFHRLEAAKIAGLQSIEADIREGDRQAAAWAALGANLTHGKRLSPGDRRKQVLLALRHPMSGEYSSQKLADYLGVSKSTVQHRRQEFEAAGLIEPRTQLVGKNGKTYDRSRYPGRPPERKEPLQKAEDPATCKREHSTSLGRYHRKAGRITIHLDPENHAEGVCDIRHLMGREYVLRFARTAIEMHRSGDL